MIFSGRAHRKLAQEISAYLNIPLGAADCFNFSDGEIMCQLQQNVPQHPVGRGRLLQLLRWRDHVPAAGERARCRANSPIEKVLIPNTTPLEDKLRCCSKLHPLSVAPLLGEAIRRINQHSSVSSVFV